MIIGKPFERPDAGVFVGTIIDVVDLGLVPSRNPAFPDPQIRLRIVWVLNANNKEGKPFQIIEQPTQKWSDGGRGSKKKSRLYEICEGVLGTAPPVPFDPETVLLGRSNALFLAKEGEYTVIKGFMPVPTGSTPPKAPVDFIRYKDRPKTNVTQTTGQTQQAQAVEQARTAAASPSTEVQDEEIPF